MNTATSTPPVFRLRKKTGFATQRDLWTFAWFVAGQTAAQIQVQGVSALRRGHINASAPLAVDATTASSKPTPEVYRPRSRTGLAFKSDLVALDRWLRPVLEEKWRSNDKQVTLRRDARLERLPLPSGDGLLLRADLLPYLQAAAARLGFAVDAPDISGSRDTGGGFKVNRTRRVAGLKLWLQLRYGVAQVCAINIASPSEDGYTTEEVDTFTYTLGSWSDTASRSGDITGGGPGDTLPDCDDIDYSSTYDPNFNYGDFVSASASDTVVSWDAATAAAAAAMDNDGAESLEWDVTWEKAQWRAASEEIRSFWFATSSLQLASGYIGVQYTRPKFKIENTGDTQLVVQAEHVRLSDSQTESLWDIVVDPGETSDWIECRDPDFGEIWDTIITRVRMGGF